MACDDARRHNVSHAAIGNKHQGWTKEVEVVQESESRGLGLMYLG